MITGRDARCIVTDDEELLQEYCYDVVSGIALRWQVIDEGVTSVTAIEVFEPTSQDLAPAGPVEVGPAMEAGTPAGWISARSTSVTSIWTTWS